MANPTIYAHTYWADKGKYPQTLEALQTLVPEAGEVKDAENKPALEQFRIASNCYYDLYNNGLCNRGDEFEEVFGFAGPDYHDELTQEVVDRTEDAMNRIIVAAAQEQGIYIPEELDATAIQAEVDRLSTELASNHDKLTKFVEPSKPFVQLS